MWGEGEGDEQGMKKREEGKGRFANKGRTGRMDGRKMERKRGVAERNGSMVLDPVCSVWILRMYGGGGETGWGWMQEEEEWR